MNASGHRLPVAWIRDRAGAALWGGLIASALLAFAASAQEATEGGKAPASDGSTETAVERATSGAEPVGPPSDAEPPAPDAVEEPDSELAEPDPGKRAPRAAPGIEEIEVVGRRMEIVVPDMTVSAVGFDPEELKTERISDIRDLSNFTPSLEIKSAFAASNPTIFIRGVGLDDYNANSASAVAIYQDGVYMASPAGQLFQFFDAESVTVLRGPQPTLFRNAEAGAILVNSREPTEEFEATATGTYGNYNLIEAEGAVGGPIIPELLMGRVSGTWGIRDGITKNRCAAPLDSTGTSSTDDTCRLSNPPTPADLKFQQGMDRWTNDLDAYAARGQLLFTPSLGETEMAWLANVHGGKNKSRAFQYQHRGVTFPSITSETPIFGGEDFSGYQDKDDDPFAGAYNLDGPENIKLFGSNLRGSWLFGDGYELRSLTAYEWHDRFTHENSDAGPRYALESEYDDTAWQLSQDLILQGDWESLFTSEFGDGEWTLGTYYLQEDLDVVNNFDSAATGPPQHLSQEYTQETRNLAAYLRSEYRIQPGCTLIPCGFTLIGGIRYNWEHKNFETSVCEFGGSESCGFDALKDASDEATWTAPSGEVSLAWDFAEDSSLYVKYSRGWKGGHFNGGAVTTFDIITSIEPEAVDSYEGGLRSYWFDRRLMLNATFFYYDWREMQVFVIEQTPRPGGYPIPKLVNAARAGVYGVELDLEAEPLSGLNLRYNFAWVESEYKDFTVNYPRKIQPPRPCDRGCPRPEVIIVPVEYVYTGNPLIASPKFSMTGSVEYDLALPGTFLGQGLGSLTPRFSFTWKDQVFYDACGGKGTRCNFPAGYFGQEPYWVFNAALTWRSEDERFELLGWVHNFMNRYYKTQTFDLSELGIILDAYAEPRTYGITATISF